MGRTPADPSHRRRGPIRRWLDARRHSRRAAQQSRRQRQTAHHDARRAELRDLLADLVDAVDSTEAARVAALIRRIIRIDPHHPRLFGLAARWAIHRNNLAQAVRWLDAHPHPTDDTRLLALLLQCRTGDKALAHLQLSDWCRSPDAPATAHALLATLDDQTDLAPTSQADPATRTGAVHAPAWQAHALQCVARDDLDAAKSQIGLLAHRFSADPSINAWLKSLELDQTAHDQPVSVAIVDELAGQLLDRTHVIGVLVRAQRHQPQPAQIDLLRRALRRLVDDLPEPLPAVEALAELSIMAADPDEARRWIERGLAISPYSAKLALMLNQVSDAAEAESRPNVALSVLRRCADAHPSYPDVRRAMILRCRDAGLNQIALQEARRWADQAPDLHTAQQVLRELAA